MNEYDVTDGGSIAEERMALGTGRSGLDRRQLLGGLAAGVGGLLLPRQRASAQTEGSSGGAKTINLTLKNQVFYSKVHYSFQVMEYRDTGGPKQWVTLLQAELDKGKFILLHGVPAPFLYSAYAAIEVSYNWEDPLTDQRGGWGRPLRLEFENPWAGLPLVGPLVLPNRRDCAEVDVGESQNAVATQRSYPWYLKATRTEDTDFKEFTVEVVKMSTQGEPLGDTNDTNDTSGNNDSNDTNNNHGSKRNKGHKGNKHSKRNNGNNDNTKRRRKQRGGGLSDVDRRERPMDRLQD